MMVESRHRIGTRPLPFRGNLLLLLLALNVGCRQEDNGSAVETIAIDEVISRLSEDDRKVNNFSSQVRVTTYDLDGDPLNLPKTGVRYYMKPDRSMLCLKSANGESEIYSEVGQVVRRKDGDAIKAEIVPDSFFLRDLRMLIAIHRGEATFPFDSVRQGKRVKESNPDHPRFVFEPGGWQTLPVNKHNVYRISMEAKDYEKVILQVDLNIGTVVEKEVIALPSGDRIAYECHADFVPVNSSYLPGKTVYEYSLQRVVIDLWNYQAEIQLEANEFLLNGARCTEVANSF